MLSTVWGMTTEERDQDPIDTRGYDLAFEVVARRMERRIRAGEFPYHGRLPSEPELAEWYGVSRTTIRHSAAVLAAKGIVEIRRGKGTYVTWQPELRQPRRQPRVHGNANVRGGKVFGRQVLSVCVCTYANVRVQC